MRVGKPGKGGQWLRLFPEEGADPGHSCSLPTMAGRAEPPGTTVREAQVGRNGALPSSSVLGTETCQME